MPDDNQEQIELECLYCGTPKSFPLDSPEAQGIFNVFCDGRCEDLYSATL